MGQPGTSSAPGSGRVLAGPPSRAPAPSPAPVPVADQRLHLLRRTTYGLHSGLLADVPPGHEASWLAAQLDPAGVDDSACLAYLTRFTGLDWSITQARARLSLGSWDLMFTLAAATIARALWSRRQLFELMVEFWSDLLNITCPSSDVWDCRHRFDADVIRANALGRFADLLTASTVHPAMLHYLNNDESTGEAPNENLGRELLELHTVGVDAGYTEADVLSCARILTGAGADWVTGEYTYRPQVHWTGPVRVLGFADANQAADGHPVIPALTGYLARHPATARRICGRLVVRFIADEPPAGLVEQLAAIYLASDTAIVPVLTALFASPAFAASADAKVRRPYEALLASARAFELAPEATGTAGVTDLYWMLGDLGMQPLGWPQPNGYPDDAVSWQSTAGTLARWNANLSLAANWWPTDFTRTGLLAMLAGPLPATHGELITSLGDRFCSRAVSAADRDTLCAFLGVSAATPLTAGSDAVGWRLPYVVALLLDSPAQMLR